MAGSYTVRDVCKAYNIQCDAFDLKDGFNALTDTLPAKKYDMIFIHPPYMSIIRYSSDERDLSNSSDVQDFMKKLGSVVSRMSEYLSENGHLVVLLGNVRKNGSYYPLPAYLETIFHKELREELIKIQHNVNSDGIEYQWSKGIFIPIMHEKVLVFAGFKPITWAELILRAMRELGGTASNQELYEALSRHPKIITNPTYKATIRKNLQENAKQVELGVWTLEGRQEQKG